MLVGAEKCTDGQKVSLAEVEGGEEEEDGKGKRVSSAVQPDQSKKKNFFRQKKISTFAPLTSHSPFFPCNEKKRKNKNRQCSKTCGIKTRVSRSRNATMISNNVLKRGAVPTLNRVWGRGCLPPLELRSRMVRTPTNFYLGDELCLHYKKKDNNNNNSCSMACKNTLLCTFFFL